MLVAYRHDDCFGLYCGDALQHAWLILVGGIGFGITKFEVSSPDKLCCAFHRQITIFVCCFLGDGRRRFG